MSKTKKTRKEFEAWADAELAKIQKLLQLSEFDLKKIKPSKKEDTSYSLFRYPYRDINVQYGENVFKDWQDGDKLEAWKILLHEMVHPLTDPLYSVACERFISKDQLESEREILTDRISNLIQSILKKQ